MEAILDCAQYSMMITWQYHSAEEANIVAENVKCHVGGSIKSPEEAGEKLAAEAVQAVLDANN